MIDCTFEDSNNLNFDIGFMTKVEEYIQKGYICLVEKPRSDTNEISKARKWKAPEQMMKYIHHVDYLVLCFEHTHEEGCCLILVEEHS